MIARLRRVPERTWLRLAVGVAVTAGLLLGGAAMVSAVTNAVDEANEHENDRVLREQVGDLTTELRCRSAESSHATELEGEITREGWLAMTIWATTGDSDHPRITEAAERVAQLYDDLGPALVERRESTATCAR